MNTTTKASLSTDLTINPEGVETIARVALARSTDSSRFQLTGVYLDLPHNRVVATDGKVLAIGKLPNGPGSAWEGTCAASILLPAECVSKIVACFSWRKKDGKMSFGNKRSTPRVLLRIQGNFPHTITLDTLDSQQTWKAMEGAFPDYRSVLPGYHDNQIEKYKHHNQRINPEFLLLAHKVILGDMPPTTLDLVSRSPEHPAWLVNTLDQVAIALMPLIQAKDKDEETEKHNRGKLQEFFVGEAGA